MSKHWLILIGGLALGGCAHSPGAQSGAYETRLVALEPVESVTINGPFKVTVLGTADQAEASLSGPASMLADATAEVRDTTLVIEFSDDQERSWQPGAGVYATVLLPKLSSVAVSGSADVDIIGAEAAEFQAGVGGSGSISVSQLKAETVQLGIGGSGSIEARGTAKSAQYGIGGSGTIEAKRLRVETAQIGIGGSGSVYADVSETAEIGIGGSGTVEVVGGAECQFAETQADMIECR